MNRSPSRHSRRQFVQGVGVVGLGVVASCALPLQTRPPPRVYRIGYLSSGPTELNSPPAPWSPSYAAFQEGLRNYGYVEDQNLVVELRATDRGEERLRDLATELEQLPVDVLVAVSAAAGPAKQATKNVPIVFVGGGDPVARGLVASLARPGGNVTGLSAEVQGGLAEKQLELLKEAAPGIVRVAVLEDANFAQRRADTPAAEAMGLQLLPLHVRSPEDLETVFEGAMQGHADGLRFVDTPLLSLSRARVAEIALRHRLPSIAQFREFAEAGGLMAYGPSVTALNRRVGYYVDRILNGAKPADLPVEQPREFDFVINLKTAQALGLTIPQHVLLQATEVIQ